jgi:hypothetical protein
MSGGGNQFGIVVEFVIKAFPTWGPFTVGVLAIPGKEIDETLSAIQVRLTDSTRE